MAQIRIEEKKGGSILPWILGLLILALAIWGVAELFEEGGEELAETEYVAPVVDDVEEVSSDIVDNTPDVYAGFREEVNDFMAYTASMQGEMGLDHDFSHDALTLLATATAAVADAHDVEISDNTERAKQLADDITKDPYATDHADKIRMAALQITESLERIDKWAYDNANMSALKELRAQAQDINAKTLTLNQKEDVRSFFGAARTVLANMK